MDSMTRIELIYKLWNIIRLFDRPGMRYILGNIATGLCKRHTHTDVEIFYHGLWTHRVGSYYFPDGYRFNYTLSTFGCWKDQEKKYLSNAEDFWFQHYRPQKGDIVLDIGAGRGEDVLAFSQGVGDTGRVIAIEAHSLSFQILNKFCVLNRLANTTPLQAVLMDKPGTVSMVESDIWEENAVDLVNGPAGTEIQATTLDQVCEDEDVKEIAFLKMNIEGAERYALLGAEAVIQRVRTICVACHDFRADYGEGEQFRTRDFVERFLTEHGFKVISRPDDPRKYVRDHLFGLR